MKVTLAGVALVGLLVTCPAPAHSQYECEMDSRECSPPSPSGALGYAALWFPDSPYDDTSFGFQLCYGILEGTPIGAEIRRAGQNGEEVLYTLIEGEFPSYYVEVFNGWDPADASDLDEQILSIVIMTTAYPSGEVCGSIYRHMPVLKTTWGHVRTLFR